MNESVKSNPTVKGYEPYLERRRTWERFTEADLADFKKRCSPGVTTEYHRQRREDIIRWFGKPPEELTLNELKDYSKPGFNAQFFLGGLWAQLTADEQETVKRLSEGAFVFAGEFDTDRNFHLACAARLKRFFGREFTVNP
jgi:hypothetical protein